MDAAPGPIDAAAHAVWRPEGCRYVAMVLQGGGALGAYQAGAYQALHEAGLEPDWLTGVSIGSINAAIIAGNPPDRRVERLREFWNTVTSRPGVPFTADGDDAHKLRNAWSAWSAMTQGQPGFFSPRIPGPWLSPRGGKQATAFYDSAPLRETLLRLVDFDLINSGQTRFAVGAVNVGDGNFTYFDNAEAAIVPEHVMASGALPPALPMIQLGTDWFWDGGLVSNTPLQQVIGKIDGHNALVFQLDLFSARGPIPRDMFDVLRREKDIRYSSRTRMTTDRYMEIIELKRQMRALLARIPDADLKDEERTLKRRLEDLPKLSIVHLIYQQAAYEGWASDYDFSGASMRKHWDSGYRDTQRTLRHRDWLAMPADEVGVVVHDVHRPEE
jgi:NTE family protein